VFVSWLTALRLSKLGHSFSLIGKSPTSPINQHGLR
jgi:hypothetical protein